MADAKKKQLVYNMCVVLADNVCCQSELTAECHSIDFLRTSSQDGTIKEDDKESLDVAGVFSTRFDIIILS